MTTKLDTKVYTEKFEYVREMVQTFIDMEEKFFERKPEELFDEGTWHVGFFELNLSQLTFKQVQTQVDRMMKVGGTEQEPYNTALARVHSLFVNIAMATGEEFLEELEENCVVGMMHLCDDDHNKRRNVYKTFRKLVDKYPVLIISSIGSAYFRAKHIAFTRRPGRDSQKSSKPGVTPRSLKA